MLCHISYKACCFLSNGMRLITLRSGTSHHEVSFHLFSFFSLAPHLLCSICRALDLSVCTGTAAPSSCQSPAVFVGFCWLYVTLDPIEGLQLDITVGFMKKIKLSNSLFIKTRFIIVLLKSRLPFIFPFSLNQIKNRMCLTLLIFLDSCVCTSFNNLNFLISCTSSNQQQCPTQTTDVFCVSSFRL